MIVSKFGFVLIKSEISLIISVAHKIQNAKALIDIETNAERVGLFTLDHFFNQSYALEPCMVRVYWDHKIALQFEVFFLIFTSVGSVDRNFRR